MCLISGPPFLHLQFLKSDSSVPVQVGRVRDLVPKVGHDLRVTVVTETIFHVIGLSQLFVYYCSRKSRSSSNSCDWNNFSLYWFLYYCLSLIVPASHDFWVTVVTEIISHVIDLSQLFVYYCSSKSWYSSRSWNYWVNVRIAFTGGQCYWI